MTATAITAITAALTVALIVSIALNLALISVGLDLKAQRDTLAPLDEDGAR